MRYGKTMDMKYTVGIDVIMHIYQRMIYVMILFMIYVKPVAFRNDHLFFLYDHLF